MDVMVRGVWYNDSTAGVGMHCLRCDDFFGECDESPLSALVALAANHVCTPALVKEQTDPRPA